MRGRARAQVSREEVLFCARKKEQLCFVVIDQLMTPTSHSAMQGENAKKRAATIICTLLLLSALMALSSVILVEKERTSRNYYDTFEKGRSGRKSAFRFLDSIMKGKKKALSEKKKGFVDVVEDDQMGGDLIVVKEDNQEEEGL